MEKFYNQEISRIKGEILRFNCMIEARRTKKEKLENELNQTRNTQQNWQSTFISITKIENLEETLQIFKSEEQKYIKYAQEELDSLIEKTKTLKINNSSDGPNTISKRKV